MVNRTNRSAHLLRKLGRFGQSINTNGKMRELKYRLSAPARTHLAARRQRSVTNISLRPSLAAASIVLVVVVKNEAPRLQFFLEYYRELGVEHFILIDNESVDNPQGQVEGMDDVSYLVAKGDFKRARFGGDWVNYILHHHCVGKWVLWVDADEFLVFSADPKNTLRDLRDEMLRRGQTSLRTLLLDMYSQNPPSLNIVPVGVNPLSVCNLFDKAGYLQIPDFGGRAFWVKGGVRGRLFFDDITLGPALNKTVMVLWRRRCVYLRVAHELWPYHLNNSKVAAAILLHFKFTSISAYKMLDSDVRGQHTSEYAAYDRINEVSFCNQRYTEVYTDATSAISAGLFEPIV